jgi:hypothetical protein
MAGNYTPKDEGVHEPMGNEGRRPPAQPPLDPSVEALNVGPPRAHSGGDARSVSRSRRRGFADAANAQSA